MPNDSSTTVKLATEPFRDAGRDYVLTLWRQTLRSADDLEIVSYFNRHPGQTTFPNTALFLVASEGPASTQGRIVWTTYVYNNTGIRPQETWLADIARPISGKTVFPVVVKSIGWNADVRVYEANLDGNLGSYPLDLDPKLIDKWPLASNPIASDKSDLQGRDIAGVAEIHAQLEGGVITVRGKRELKEMPAVVYRLDLKSKQWSRAFEPLAGQGTPGKNER